MALKMATILPQPYLHMTQEAEVHMALAHLVGAEGMEQYTNFYKDLRYGLKILDNGVIENAQVDIETLVQKADMIGASEIILPDVYKDSKATFRRVEKDIHWLKEHNIEKRVMVVPQGASLDDWLKCALALLNNFGTEIDVIGIPKHLIVTANDRDARLKAIAQLADLCPTMDSYQIHLLGCWRTPLEVLTIAKASEQKIIPEVRSCDSAIAYVYARKGKKFSDDDRPDSDPIDFKNGIIKEELLLEYNVAAWIMVGEPAADRAVYFL